VINFKNKWQVEGLQITSEWQSHWSLWSLVLLSQLKFYQQFSRILTLMVEV